MHQLSSFKYQIEEYYMHKASKHQNIMNLYIKLVKTDMELGKTGQKQA